MAHPLTHPPTSQLFLNAQGRVEVDNGGWLSGPPTHPGGGGSTTQPKFPLRPKQRVCVWRGWGVHLGHQQVGQGRVLVSLLRHRNHCSVRVGAGAKSWAACLAAGFKEVDCGMLRGPHPTWPGRAGQPCTQPCQQSSPMPQSPQCAWRTSQTPPPQCP